MTITKLEGGRPPKLWEAAAIAEALDFSLDVFKPSHQGGVAFGGFDAQVLLPQRPGGYDPDSPAAQDAAEQLEQTVRAAYVQLPDPAPEGSMERAVQDKIRQEQIERGESDG
ncbi:hypothetical protein AXK60_11690 [Tsukamurella pseudospumae]|uniref:Uncharacterized protein n=1 Tax=Tsukamurella pseudospumae TaxID=239498 RepID=A0A138A8B8_9ACTN|nr:hypothetical protein AXK60_11690 [Tsukamurella pseudospumae]